MKTRTAISETGSKRHIINERFTVTKTLDECLSYCGTGNFEEESVERGELMQVEREYEDLCKKCIKSLHMLVICGHCDDPIRRHEVDVLFKFDTRDNHELTRNSGLVTRYHSRCIMNIINDPNTRAAASDIARGRVSIDPYEDQN